MLVTLHHKGAVISSREAKWASCSSWDSFFSFDLPPGDISTLPLMLEFLIMQVKNKTKLISKTKLTVKQNTKVRFLFLWAASGTFPR